MKSALLRLMWSDGWHLGYPVAVVVESRADDGKLYLEQAFMGYIVDADYAGMTLESSRGKCYISLKDVDREVHEHGRRCWSIQTPSGEIKIGQAFVFAKQVAYWAQELACAQYGTMVRTTRVRVHTSLRRNNGTNSTM